MIGRSEARRSHAERMLGKAQRSAPAGWRIGDWVQVMACAPFALVDCGDRAHIVGRHSSGMSAADFASLAERLGGRVSAQVLCGERVAIFGHAKDDQGACGECVTRWLQDGDT